MRPFLLTTLAVLLVLVAAPRRADADIVHLRTGEAVKGRAVQEASTDAFLAFEDYATGARRRFSWNAIDESDRDEIWERWGWLNRGQGIVEGVELELRQQGGDTQAVRGVIVRETPTHVVLATQGDEIEIPKSRIEGQEPIELDAREVYEPSKLVKLYLDDMKEKQGVDVENPDSRTHWNIAVYAAWAGDYETARDHYQAAAADEGYLKSDLAAARLAQVEQLILDREALGALRDIRMKLSMKLFDRVRTMLDEFATANADMSPEVSRQMERLRSDFEQKRAEYLQLTAARKFTKFVERLIDDEVRDKELRITDVMSWTRRDLPDAAFARLAEEMQRYDESVTPEQARTFWEARPERPWRRATYGSGTFVVDPAEVKQSRTPRRASGGSRGGGGASPIQIPKPPTRDQWWERASTKERAQWLLAYFIERSDLYELADPEARNCSMCMGAGLLSKALQTGETLQYLCVRCAGTQQDRIVKFR